MSRQRMSRVGWQGVARGLHLPTNFMRLVKKLTGRLVYGLSNFII